jgi:predicted metal-dependent HD superfamily phosphohydrolase
MDSLEKYFFDLASKYSGKEDLKSALWKEIHTSYTSRKRFYHNLDHLRSMIHELEEVKAEIYDYDAILFSVFYHDIVYSASSKENEEKSAEIARQRLAQLGLSDDFITKVETQILATKKHERSGVPDINYLLDADLSVLGRDWETYSRYITQIRKEYSIYPDLLYKPGRKKVLNHFLGFDEIFKTGHFKKKYESQARENIKKEIELY